MPTLLIFFAVGVGVRMQSDVPKVLNKFAGLPLFGHALNSAVELDERYGIVVGHGVLAVARARQVNKPGFARKLLSRLRATKAAKKG